jgi:hypothetical protein
MARRRDAIAPRVGKSIGCIAIFSASRGHAKYRDSSSRTS